MGLAYELLVMEVLKRYSFQIKHTGGAGDGGQDFNGYWVLPDKRVPVVGEATTSSILLEMLIYSSTIIK